MRASRAWSRSMVEVLDPQANSSSGRRWFTGLVIGLIFGLATLVGGTVMAVLGLVATGLISVRAGRTAAIGGVLAGLGACWLVLFVSAGTRCGPGCYVPDLTPWILASVAALAVGFGLTVLAWASNKR